MRANFQGGAAHRKMLVRPARRHRHQIRLLFLQHLRISRIMPRRFGPAGRARIGKRHYLNARMIVENHIQPMPVIPFARMPDDRRLILALLTHGLHRQRQPGQQQSEFTSTYLAHKTTYKVPSAKFQAPTSAQKFGDGQAYFQLQNVLDSWTAACDDDGLLFPCSCRFMAKYWYSIKLSEPVN